MSIIFALIIIAAVVHYVATDFEKTLKRERHDQTR